MLLYNNFKSGITTTTSTTLNYIYRCCSSIGTTTTPSGRYVHHHDHRNLVDSNKYMISSLSTSSLSSFPSSRRNQNQILLPKYYSTSSSPSLSTDNKDEQESYSLRSYKSIQIVLNKYKFNPFTIPVSNCYINYDTYQPNLIQQLSLNNNKNNDNNSNNEDYNILNEHVIIESKSRMFIEQPSPSSNDGGELPINQLIDLIMNQVSSASTLSSTSPITIWSQQLIPNSVEIKGESINEIATNTFNIIYPLLYLLHQQSLSTSSLSSSSPSTSPFKFIFSPLVLMESLSSRCDLIRKRIIEKLKDTKKQLYNTMIPIDSPQYNSLSKFNQSNNNNNNSDDDNGIIDRNSLYTCQLIMIDSQTVRVSISKVGYDNDLGWTLPSPFQLGVAPLKESKVPPSRAYIKLLEGLVLTGRIPSNGDRCVELGSSPGGWTSLLLSLNNKIKLESVDRSPLDPKLTKRFHPPTLTHTIGNGVIWLPKTPAQWLFNDMSIPPEKSINVLDQWITNGHVTDTFVWTLKFVGSHHDPSTYNQAIDQIHQMMKKHIDQRRVKNYIIRHLVNHGNELLIIGKII